MNNTTDNTDVYIENYFDGYVQIEHASHTEHTNLESNPIVQTHVDSDSPVEIKQPEVKQPDVKQPEVNPAVSSYIYILQLEKGKYYVGYTERKDGERFNEHFSGKGSAWTKLYKPVQVTEWRPGTLADENHVTLETMDKFGWWNVRGGKWCSVNMETPPTELFKSATVTTFTKMVGLLSYMLNDKKPTFMGAEKKLVCYRCGRNTHFANTCYAKTHLNGKRL